MEQVKA